MSACLMFSREKISALTDSGVNAEIELTLPGGDEIVAIVTEAGIKSLDFNVETT